ncbi:nuclear transport factor 2 family protein [bacterium]|nr:nuclear transport factor 2 family protein [bacterium]
MKILRPIISIILSLILFMVLTGTLKHPHDAHYNPSSDAIYGLGNAPDSVRVEIKTLLNAFQSGYTSRDLKNVKPFTESMFALKNVLILGTMPNEIFIGHTGAEKLVHNDWAFWGDCTFAVENAHISSHGNVAWISMIGAVRFDISRHLYLPLRISGVAVKELSEWKFQQMNFQFDLNLQGLLITIALLLIWFVVSMLWLIVTLIQTVKTRKS